MHLFSVSAWPEDGGIRYRDDSAKDLKFYLRLFNGSGERIYRSAFNFSRVGNVVC
jgi:outer membrane phospholipase A